MPRPPRSVLIAAAAAVLALAGCTSHGHDRPGRTSTVTNVETHTSPGADPNAFTPAPASTVKPLPPGKKPPKGETEKLCPYVRSGKDQDPTSKPNIADLQGNRVGRTTVLTGLKPVGCRFYFAYDFQAVADILPRTFATATQAHNAMVRTAEQGNSVLSVPQFVPGVDGISYRTKFYRPDGDKDWAFVFAKGKVLVVVHTEETTTSQNAVNIARAIAGKF